MVTETTSKGEKANASFVWSMAQDMSLHFPQVVDPDKSLYKYANSSSISLPFNVAVDLRDMTIVKAVGGKKTLDEITQLARSTLGP